jgi:hypothetical protein
MPKYVLTSHWSALKSSNKRQSGATGDVDRPLALAWLKKPIDSALRKICVDFALSRRRIELALIDLALY